jgi:hypothetical protein
MTTLRIENLISRSFLRCGVLLIPFAVACFALSQMAQAVTPPPDGGYPGGNTAEGDSALFSLTTGYYNTANGYRALFRNTTGFKNTADGFRALYLNTTGYQNVAAGFQALYNNTTGFNNTAVGLNALYGNTTGYANTATGIQALTSNTTGANNTATGDGALYHTTDGRANTAIGYQALYSNTNGNGNTAIGYAALHSNTANGGNTAIGYFALQSNTTGITNTAVGDQALYSHTTGDGNMAVGDFALYHHSTGYNNIALGFGAGGALTTGDDNIDIGNGGVAGESNTMRIGQTLSYGGSGQTRTFIAAIRGVTTGNADAIPVVIDSAGQLGTMSSSRRFKKEIKAMDKTSQAILALKPVTFHYKSDSKDTPQFGLIAEEVAEVNPDLVVRDANGEIYTVRYEAVNAMLLNEFLKEHLKVEEQDRKVQKLEAAAAHQQEQIEALTAGLQRVSAQVEMSRPASQMALNDQ